MHYRILATALVATSVALAACGDDGTGLNGNNATVRFVNATSSTLGAGSPDGWL